MNRRRTVVAVCVALSAALATWPGTAGAVALETERAVEADSARARPGPAPEIDADTKSVIEGNNAFALDLYAQLRKGEEGNLFFSPYSISAALAMTYAGARGDTEAQMAKVLHFKLEQLLLHAAFRALNDRVLGGKKERAYQLHVANALWGQKGHRFLDFYLELVRANYGAGLRQVDFMRATEEARQRINAWVEEQTQDKIKELIKRGILDRLTTLVLTNAIYFKGNWASRFDVKQTRDEPFTLLDGKKVNVPMMHQAAKFKYVGDKSVQTLELPYVDDELSMIVLLPRKGDGLPALERSLTKNNLAKWLSGLREQEVEVALPRFKSTWACELQNELKSMGMTDAFSLPAADFSGMTGEQDLLIDKVIHKAFVDVNEEGTEAAAATAVVAKLKSVPVTPAVFRADHPFMFLIRDNRSGSILFLGRLMSPKG